MTAFWKPRSRRRRSGTMLLKITRPAVVGIQRAASVAPAGGWYQ